VFLVCSKLEVRPGLLLATTVCILRDTFRILDTLNFRYNYCVGLQFIHCYVGRKLIGFKFDESIGFLVEHMSPTLACRC
jgi:hypothetical protein